MTSKQFGKTIKEHILKIIDEVFKLSNNENRSKIVVNTTKRFAITEYLVNSSDCASNYKLKRFKIVRKKNIFKILLNLILNAFC